MRPWLITAENARHGVCAGLASHRFNEAAAHHRGEREERIEGDCAARAASMRPRLITAENLGALILISRHAGIASMRPRLITAENRGDQGDAAMERRASMRPRLITAENPPSSAAAVEAADASMRPRLITAENAPSGAPTRSPCSWLQ